MTEYTGGLRNRLVSDSVYNLVGYVLDQLGWLDTGRDYRNIELRSEPYEHNVEIPLNSVIVVTTHTTDDDAEMGSNMGEVRTVYYVDFYAENDALGKHLTHDIKDALLGRMPAIGRIGAVLHVRDWTMATPPIIFYCDIENVMVDKAVDFPKAWQKHWWTCRFEIVDTYGGPTDE